MLQLQNERSAGRKEPVMVLCITAVHAERWWKVANCCNRLQWVDCICFGPAVSNIIGYGTVPSQPSDFSKFIGSGTLPWHPPVVQLHFMWLAKSCSWLWLWTWNMILSYLLFSTRCFRYGSFLLNLVLLVSTELISVCVSLHECGSRSVWLENLQFSNCLFAISVWIFDLN